MGMGNGHLSLALLCLPGALELVTLGKWWEGVMGRAGGQTDQRGLVRMRGGRDLGRSQPKARGRVAA